MTNPDNVGGLPELPAWMSDYTIPNDEFEVGKDVRLSDRMRAYGELCRAAPAGGEDLVRFATRMASLNLQEVGGDLDDRIRFEVATFLRSAHAGAGEVEKLIDDLIDHAFNDGNEGVEFRSEKVNAVRAALLRKLQQGADGWRPIESAPEHGSFLVHRDGHVMAAYRTGGEIMHEALHEPFIAKPTHWQPYPEPASQGQEGGHD